MNVCVRECVCISERVGACLGVCWSYFAEREREREREWESERVREGILSGREDWKDDGLKRKRSVIKIQPTEAAAAAAAAAVAAAAAAAASL